jgi:hypothetical protein
MSDKESIAYDAALDAMADYQHSQHQADLQEQAEVTLMELLPSEDVDDLLTKLKDQDAYGNSLHAVLMGLVNSVQHKTDKEQKNRIKAGINSGLSRTETAVEKLERRQEVADDLFESGLYAFKKDVAEEVIRREIAYRRSCRDFLGRE